MLGSTRPGGKDLRKKGGDSGISRRSGHGQGNNAETFHLLCCPVVRTIGVKQSCGLV